MNLLDPKSPGDSTDEKALLWKQKEKKTALLDPKSLGDSTGEKKMDTKKKTRSKESWRQRRRFKFYVYIYLSTTYLCLAIT